MRAVWLKSARRLAVLFFMVLLCFFSARAQTRRDGNWWIVQSESAKLDYIVGFFDGMDLGHSFTIWRIMSADSKDACISKGLSSYDTLSKEYLENVTSGQLVSGLNEFYVDYRNRSILISDGAWAVARQIAGDPKEKIDDLINNLRRNAQAPTQLPSQ
jgi:hypothetical protein